MITQVERAYPSVEVCFRRAQSLALLNALMSPEWERYSHSMNVAWADGEQMASVRNGEGDFAFFLFRSGMCSYKEIDHEQPDFLPEFSEFVQEHRATLPDLAQGVFEEPAFYADECTVLGWHESRGQGWQELVSTGTPEQIALRLSALIFTGTPERYVAWAEEYYGQKIQVEAVRRIFEHQLLGEDLVQSVNPSLTVREVLADAHEIGYPTAQLPTRSEH